MARRMKQQKEYYWQGKGGEGVFLEKIISELLGRDFDINADSAAIGDPTDVYTLQFDCYNDISPIEGHSIIQVPHNENHRIMFSIVLLDSTNVATSITSDTTIDNSLIDDIEIFEFAVYLRKIASNQPMRFDWS